MADAALGNANTLKQARVSMRNHFLETAQRFCFGRGDTLRSFKYSQMTYLPYPAKEGAWVPDVDAQALVFTTEAFKGGKGGDQGNVVLGRHRDVSQCPVAALTMLTYLQLACGEGPGLASVVEHKKDWYAWRVSTYASRHLWQYSVHNPKQPIFTMPSAYVHVPALHDLTTVLCVYSRSCALAPTLLPTSGVRQIVETPCLRPHGDISKVARVAHQQPLSTTLTRCLHTKHAAGANYTAVLTSLLAGCVRKNAGIALQRR